MTIRTALTITLVAGSLLLPLAACSSDGSTSSAADTPQQRRHDDGSR